MICMAENRKCGKKNCGVVEHFSWNCGSCLCWSTRLKHPQASSSSYTTLVSPKMCKKSGVLTKGPSTTLSNAKNIRESTGSPTIPNTQCENNDTLTVWITSLCCPTVLISQNLSLCLMPWLFTNLLTRKAYPAIEANCVTIWLLWCCSMYICI